MKCRACGKELEEVKGKQRVYCDVRCRRKFNRDKFRAKNPLPIYDRVCKYCGKPFQTTNQRKEYCEEMCRKRQATKLFLMKTHTATNRKCLNCGKPIPRMARTDQLFCHRNCQAQYGRNKGKKVQQIECAYCKELFTPRNCRHRYCTEWCAKAALGRSGRLTPHSECFRKTTGAPLSDMEKGLRRVEKEARNAKMSYGKYQALLYLKEQEDARLQNRTKHNLIGR